MKKISLILTKVFSILFIFLFILIPNIKADEDCSPKGNYQECTKSIDSYFFMLETNDCSNGKCSVSESKFYTAYYINPRSDEIKKGEELEYTNITLQSESCLIDQNCMTYYDFYTNYLKLDLITNYNTFNKSPYPSNEGTSKIIDYTKTKLECSTKTYTNNSTTDEYYLRGCYSKNELELISNKSDNDGISESSNKPNYTNYDIYKLCDTGFNEVYFNCIGNKSKICDSFYHIDSVINSCVEQLIKATVPDLSANEEKSKMTIEDNTILTTIVRNGQNNIIITTSNTDGNEVISPKTGLTKENQVLSPALFKTTYHLTTNKCLPDKGNNIGEASCNSGNDEIITSKCDKKTILINNGENSADVSINQTTSVANILTPTSIYQGGGFHYGFIYYNTIKWDYADTNQKNHLTDDEKEELKTIMKNKLLSIEAFTNKLDVQDVTFGGQNPNITFVKKCQRFGEFTAGNEVTTICTIFLPNSTIEDYTGKVTYNSDISNNNGISNKYYTPLTYSGTYSVYATLKNLNVLNTTNDSQFKDFDLTFDDPESCTVNVYNRLYEKDSTNYKFIYRPINLNNPFPDRNAGVNWYEWYSKDSNKKRLQESYSKLQYQVTLDNQTVAKIKDYNTNYNYLEWDNIENGESKFIDEYFNTKRQNIVGDDS